MRKNKLNKAVKSITRNPKHMILHSKEDFITSKIVESNNKKDKNNA